MARILLVGTVTLDMIFTLDHHPAADEEMRASSLRICRGGNAANTAVVLAGLGHETEFLGVLANAPELAVIESDFGRHGVSFGHCPRLPGRVPTSSIYLSGAQRSIVHCRDLPELPAQCLRGMNVSRFDWVHFEGRNVPELRGMIEHVRAAAPGASISLELEKPRQGVEQLFALPDLLLCSRGFAHHYGFDAPFRFLDWLFPQTAAAMVVAAWGEDGAYGMAVSGEVSHAPAQPPAQVVDTLGAGDTFNAGMIHALLDHLQLSGALENGCRLAGRKCGGQGFDGL